MAFLCRSNSTPDRPQKKTSFIHWVVIDRIVIWCALYHGLNRGYDDIQEGLSNEQWYC